MNIPARASIYIYMHNTGVDHQCCLMFTWNSHSILYFLPPLRKGGAGIRGIITPVYRTCVYSNNYSLEIVCTVTTIFCCSCVKLRYHSFVQCTVKNALLMCIYI